MSAKYLTQFEELTSQGPGDLQRDCTACRQLDAVASGECVRQWTVACADVGA